MRGTISLAAHTAVTSLLERQLAEAQNDRRAADERYAALAMQILDMRHRDLTGVPKDFKAPPTLDSMIGPRTEMAIEHVSQGRSDLRAQQMSEAVRLVRLYRAEKPDMSTNDIDEIVAKMIIEGEEPA